MIAVKRSDLPPKSGCVGEVLIRKSAQGVEEVRRYRTGFRPGRERVLHPNGWTGEETIEAVQTFPFRFFYVQ